MAAENGGAADSTRRGPEQPDRLAGYTAVMAVYASLFAAALAVADRRSGRDTRSAPQMWSDVILVGVASHKLSRLVTKQTVAAPLRAPFTRDVGPAGAGERNVRPKGSGLRHSLGELLACPFCVDVWIASAGTAGLRLAPGVARPALTTFAAVAVADLLQFVHVRSEHAAR